MILEAAGFLANALLLDKDLHKEVDANERDIQKEREMALASGLGTFDLDGFQIHQPEFKELQTGSSVDLKLDSVTRYVLVELNGNRIGRVSNDYYRLNELMRALDSNNDVEVKCIRKDVSITGKVSFSFEIKS